MTYYFIGGAVSVAGLEVISYGVVAWMGITCEDCKQHDRCTSPCKAVERLLRGVTTRRENNRALPDGFTLQFDAMVEYGADGETYLSGDEWPGPKRTKRSMIILMWFHDHRNRDEIIYHSGATKQWVNKVISDEIIRRKRLAVKARCLRNDRQTVRQRITELWREHKYRAIDISRMTGANKAYVARIICGLETSALHDGTPSGGHK